MIYRYAHPEFFADWARPDYEEVNGNIVLYGAGRRGSVAAHCLNKRGIEFICFCDSDVKKQNQDYCGHKVISPEELAEKYIDSTILITTNHYHVIYEQLKKRGFKKVYSCVSLFEEIDFDGYEMFSPEYQARNIEQYFYTLVPCGNENISYISQVQLPVTMRCTLRCKECNSYIPYCDNPAEEFDFDDMVASVNKLLTGYKTIANVLLYGGEPLLYKDLDRLIATFSSNPQIEKVTIVTNGTLLPNEATLHALSKPNVYVRISNYGSLSRKMDDLLLMLQENKVNIEVTDFKFWNRNPTVDILNETEEELGRKVKNCCSIAKALTIVKGKLFFCGFSAFYDYFKAVPDFGDNNINLLEFKGSGEELKYKIDKMLQISEDGLPKKACRYCKFNNYEDNLPVAEQTRERLYFKEVY